MRHKQEQPGIQRKCATKSNTQRTERLKSELPALMTVEWNQKHSALMLINIYVQSIMIPRAEVTHMEPHFYRILNLKNI